MISQVNSGFYNALKLYPETWTINTPYSVGDFVKATAYNNHTYVCTVAGTSAPAVEPVWSTTNGATQIDNTVTWKVYDAKTYQVKAPQAAAFPYVTFGLETDIPEGIYTDFASMENLTYWVNCFSDKGQADVAELADEVMTSLDAVTLTVTGYTSMKCQREYIGSVIYDPTVNIFQIPLRYRVWISK